MSEIVLPASISTTFNIGSADIASMMTQAYIDKLKAEEEQLIADLAANYDELSSLHADIVARFQSALDKKRAVIDPLVQAINTLLGKKEKIALGLCPSLTSTRERWRFWSPYTSESRYPFHPFKETKLTSRWVLSSAATVPDEGGDEGEGDEGGDYDEGDHERVQLSTPQGERLQKLTITVSKAMKERINDVLLRRHTQSKRIDEVRLLMKDTASLERKVRAALTQQILTSQPDLMKQVVSAFATASGSLLLEVQG